MIGPKKITESDIKTIMRKAMELDRLIEDLYPEANAVARKMDRAASDYRRKARNTTRELECEPDFIISQIAPYYLAPDISYAVVNDYDVTEFSRRMPKSKMSELDELFTKYNKRICTILKKHSEPLIQRYESLRQQVIGLTIADLIYDASRNDRYALKIVDPQNNKIITALLDFSEGSYEAAEDEFEYDDEVIRRMERFARDEDMNFCVVHNHSAHINGKEMLDHVQERLKLAYMDELDYQRSAHRVTVKHVPEEVIERIIKHSRNGTGKKILA